MKQDTLCVQAGYKPKNGDPRVLPLYQSTTYFYESTEHVGKLFDLACEGHMYSRISNPTVAALEEKLAAMEGGVGAMMTSSGQAANLISLLNLCKSGQNFLSTAAIYGGTVNLFGVTMKKMGIEARFIDQDKPLEALLAAADENTRAVFCESLSNPSMAVADFEKLSALAKSLQVPLIVDNTFPTPINCRPFEWGADIVTHSSSKYLDGHASSVGGIIVDSGRFNWENGKFPDFCQPDESYHGVTYVKDFGAAAFIVKARVQLMRDLGSAPSPFNAYLTNMGVETLALRMQRHCETAQKAALFLESHPLVESVDYPDLPGNRYNGLAKKYMPGGTAGVVSFSLKGGREQAIRFMDALQLAAIVVHVADTRTCVLHPASATHRQLTDGQLKEAGISPGMVRLSVGIESCEDILADLAQALEKAN